MARKKVGSMSVHRSSPTGQVVQRRQKTYGSKLWTKEKEALLDDPNQKKLRGKLVGITEREKKRRTRVREKQARGTRKPAGGGRRTHFLEGQN